MVMNLMLFESLLFNPKLLNCRWDSINLKLIKKSFPVTCKTFNWL